MGQSLTRLASGKARKADPEDSEAGSIQMRRPGRLSAHPESAQQNLDDDVNIQPHTDEGGDAYYIGDAYEASKCAHEWEIDM